ncbi:MAG: hypothetical protein GY765_33020 [bacterium]|nr:hypothetical protein [bacterium]
MENIRSGKEILDEFFYTLEEIPGIDPRLSDKLLELYSADALTNRNLSNALLELRKEAAHDQN